MPKTVTTATPSNPSQGFNIESVEPVPKSSRWLKPVNHNGQYCQPGESLAMAYITLAQAQLSQAEELREVRRVKLWFVSRDRETQAVIRWPRGYYTASAELKTAVNPGQFSSEVKEKGLALLDRVMLEPGLQVEDEAIWKAMEQALQPEYGIKEGRAIRQINDAVCAVILRRHGIKLPSPDQLPAIGVPHPGE